MLEKAPKSRMKYGCLKRQTAVFGDSKACTSAMIKIRKINAQNHKRLQTMQHFASSTLMIPSLCNTTFLKH